MKVSVDVIDLKKERAIEVCRRIIVQLRKHNPPLSSRMILIPRDEMDAVEFGLSLGEVLIRVYSTDESDAEEISSACEQVRTSLTKIYFHIDWIKLGSHIEVIGK